MTDPRGRGGSGAQAPVSERSALKLAGWLLIGGFLINAIVTMTLHPSGDEDDHVAIFTEYADSGAWVAAHLGQFAGVMIALSGLLALYRILRARGGADLVARFAAAATIATAAVWAVLQGLDGVALKQVVDTWADASGTEKEIRFADAETVRWLEWGFQSYFRVLLGATFALFGAAIVATRVVSAWLGWLAVLGGLLSIAIGVNVGYSGLESGFQDIGVVVFQLAVLVFAVGILVTGGARAGYATPPTR
jgi:hypothetical protein